MLYNQKMRVYYVDILKVFAIFLVILGHNPLCSNVAKQWIYTFHMPAFFAVYGLTYDIKKHSQHGFINISFVVQKAKRLLLPALLWALIYASFEIKNVLLVLYGSQHSLRDAGSLSSIWFLPCMFLSVLFVEAIMLILSKLLKSERTINAVIFSLAIIFSIIAYLIPSSNNYLWSINIVPMACSFILIGYLVQSIIKSVKKLNEEKNFVWILVFVVCFVLLTFTFKYNVANISINNVDMASGTYGNYVLYMLNAICGICMLISLTVFTTFFQKSKLVLNIGRNTLALFVLHNPINKVVVAIFNKLGMSSFMISLPVTVIVIMICYVITKLIDKVLPELIGNVARSDLTHERTSDK